MRDYRLVTVTLNPAIDRVLEVEQFRVGEHIKARRIGWYPAGKGINVARVLATLGTRCVATGFVGRDDLTLFEEFLERVGRGRIVMQLLIVRGRTRENITIMDPIFDTETHIRDEGFAVQTDDVRRIISKVGMLAREETVMVFAGSMSPGVKLGDLRSMLHRCQDEGAKIVVDTSGEAMKIIRAEPVWMIKLNARELGDLTGMKTESEEDVATAGRTLMREAGGPAEYVIGTRGAAGAVLVGSDTAVTGKVFVHPGRIANTVGCGDSLLAGLLHGWVRGQNWRDSLAMGVSVATANAVSRTPGTLSISDVDEFLGAAMMEELTTTA